MGDLECIKQPLAIEETYGTSRALGSEQKKDERNFALFISGGECDFLVLPFTAFQKTGKSTNIKCHICLLLTAVPVQFYVRFPTGIRSFLLRVLQMEYALLFYASRSNYPSRML